MTHSTDFPSIRDRVSPEEWQARLGLAAWPAMLRRLAAKQQTSGYPPYWN